MSALTGKVAGTVSRSYDDNFWITSKSINSGNTVEFTLDKDGLVTNAGPLVITRDARDSFITEIALGNTTESRTYNEFGELTGKTAKYKTTTLYSVTYARDADGRVTTKTETVGTQKNIFTYDYDKAGRLIEVLKNGAHYSSYTYDSNSNRLTAAVSAGNLTGTYDSQDRLLTYGGSSFAYTANGELESQTAGAHKTTYTYDVLGNLTAATLPNGTKITYIIDPESHRVGKEVNGELETGFLNDGGQIVAQLNGSNQIVSRFVYATGAASPDYMVRGGVTYRIFSDQLGSPIIVVNASTGAIAEQISYDEFGNVLRDTNPGFQPFGFAGGLYDPDLKLVRFGVRDYEPIAGRWTAEDPILFAGGDTNLFGYTWNDPIDFYDRVGREGADGGSELTNKVGEVVIETGEHVIHAQGERIIDYPEEGPPNLNPLAGRRLNEYVEAHKPGVVENTDSAWDLWAKVKRLWRICTEALGPSDSGTSTQNAPPAGPPPPPPTTIRQYTPPNPGQP